MDNVVPVPYLTQSREKLRHWFQNTAAILKFTPLSELTTQYIISDTIVTILVTLQHRLNMELDLQSFFGLLSTAVLIV
jgi:hypothetical protein